MYAKALQPADDGKEEQAAEQEKRAPEETRPPCFELRDPGQSGLLASEGEKRRRRKKFSHLADAAGDEIAFTREL